MPVGRQMTNNQPINRQFQMAISITDEIKQGKTRMRGRCRGDISREVRGGPLEDLTLEVRSEGASRSRGRAFQVEGTTSTKAQNLNHAQ